MPANSSSSPWPTSPNITANKNGNVTIENGAGIKWKVTIHILITFLWSFICCDVIHPD
jgi:hypothetical protein